MRKNLACAVLRMVLLSSAPVRATAGTWDFSYQGFRDVASGEFDAARRLSGSFSAEDLNNDNVITQDELTVFSLDGLLYFNQAWEGCYYVGRTSCGVHEFSYRLTGELAFNARYNTYDSGVTVWGSYQIGDQFATGAYLDSEHGHESRYDWTSQTTLTVAPPPVPEPAMLPMLLAGLALAGRYVRRSKVTL